MPSKKGKYQPIGVGMTPSTTELGRYIRARRLELDLRQIPLAERTGIKQIRISHIETGEQKYLTDSELHRLAEALHCDPKELQKRRLVKIAPPQTELGRIICLRREELGMTIDDFAEKMGMSVQHAKTLGRRSRGVSYRTAELLTNVLRCGPSVFLPFIRTSEKQTMSELGRFIRSRRKALGISATQLAQRLNIVHQYVHSIEHGRCSLCQSDHLVQRLIDVLKLDVNELHAVMPKGKKRKIRAPHPTNDPLSTFLVTRRLELQLTREEVSERAKMSHGYLSIIETGRYRPSPSMLQKLSKALECEIPPECMSANQNHHPRC